MNQFRVGQKAWYNFEGRDRVYRIAEIKGNVAILEEDTPSAEKTKIEAYLTELQPHASCTIKNIIGRSSCDLDSSTK